jgi:hypothetical protein
MSRGLGSRCPSRRAGAFESSLEVAVHVSEDNVAELSLEGAHGFLLGVAASLGVVGDDAGAWIAGSWLMAMQRSGR